jgi:phospholipase C
VPVPNLSAWRRKITSDLTGAFVTGAALAGLPSLPATSLDAVVVTRECTASQQVELNTSTPSDLVPTIQAMPTQET